ncbi:RHS repeat-associated core domain-containing protein [Anoxybacillus pushchinoensis]|uniref:RHS repeat-associated core domain-containing protein n=1 Tax=Anoxybacillus pushchinoensis TaxID=150248 RepID=A0A1I0SVB6_9BACL|nr:RHS repeat-associated core domain-containing protein [Anoxybacillus pushchinoensis]
MDQNTIVQDGTYTYRFDYDERGHVRTFTTGNGAGATFTYDDRGLVKSLSVGTADGTELLAETYRYDENGNRTEIAIPTGAKTLYRYDALDQLVEEQWPDGTTIEYTYDGFGNRTKIVKTKEGSSTTTTADYNAANQLVRFGDETITYDANGNRTEDSEYQYEWNEADQLVAITRKGESAPFVTYKYDDDGRRIQKTVNGVVTNYHYQGDSLNVLYETDASGNVVQSYVYGENGQLLAMKKGGATYFYHYNAHGDVIALTDAQGNVVARYEYDTWGQLLSKSGEMADENPYRYAGYQYDEETGLYYLIARYYHPTHGVFLSMDPDPGDSDDILTQNGYTYANNNPVMMVDPDGHFVWMAINAGLAAYDGYKAYKAGKGWKGVAFSAAFGFVGGGRLKAARSAGLAAEKYLARRLGAKPVHIQRIFNIGKTKRRADIVKNGTLHEVKVGRVSASIFTRAQVAKDAWLLKNRKVKRVHWNFYISSRTGKVDPSRSLRKLLKKHGISYSIHRESF